MNALGRLPAVCAATLLLSGCSYYIADVVIHAPGPAPTFTYEEQRRAKAIMIEVAGAAGFWEPRYPPQVASMPPSSSPYREFVSLSAPGSRSSRRSVDITGYLRDDGRELSIIVRDIDRAEPLPETAKLIEDLRIALERAFPDRRVEVTHRTKNGLFGP